MTEPSRGYFKLTPLGWEARDAYAARNGGWAYPENRKHPEYRSRGTAMPYDDTDLDEPRRRSYSPEQAQLEDDLADLQARYTETLQRSEVPLYLKTCLNILAAQLNSDPGDPGDNDVLMDTAEELKALAETLAALDERMDDTISQLNGMR